MTSTRGPEAWKEIQSKTLRSEKGCLIWQGSKNAQGYGKMAIRESDGTTKTRAVHRIAYEAVVGPIPERLTIDHLCRVRACAEPAHLEAVTLRENILRGTSISARNARKTECLRGHPFDSANTYYYSGRRGCRECRAAYARETKDGGS